MLHTDLTRWERRCKNLPSPPPGHQAPLCPLLLLLLSQKIYWRSEARLTKLQPWALPFWQNALILPQHRSPADGIAKPGEVAAGRPSFPEIIGGCVHPAARGHAGALRGGLADWCSVEPETQQPSLGPAVSGTKQHPQRVILVPSCPHFQEALCIGSEQ